MKQTYYFTEKHELDMILLKNIASFIILNTEFKETPERNLINQGNTLSYLAYNIEK